MADLKINGVTPSDIKLGSSTIQKIYQGSTLVYPIGGPAVSTKVAGTGTNVAGSKEDWVNPSLITAIDLSYASNHPGDNDYSDALRGSNFGFNIPVGATIDGITLKVYRAPAAGATAGEVSDYDVYLTLNGTKKGSSKPIAEGWDHTGFVLAEYGGSSDLWGTTWTSADINDIDFGADFIVQKSGTGTFWSAFVDYMEITINYTT